MATPKKAAAYTFSRGVYSVATPGSFQVNPTIAAGDFKISKDGGALANLTNLPAVAPAGSVCVKFILTTTEMNADYVVIVGIDQAGGEWGDLVESFDTTTQTLSDLPTAIAIADAVLLRDWTAIGGSVPAYCLLNAARFLRNIWAVVAGSPPVLHVKAEDGATDAWTRNASTDSTALPITGLS